MVFQGMRAFRPHTFLSGREKGSSFPVILGRARVPAMRHLSGNVLRTPVGAHRCVRPCDRPLAGGFGVDIWGRPYKGWVDGQDMS